MNLKTFRTVVLVAWGGIIVSGVCALALTPKERDLARKIRTAVVAGIEHGKALQLANESLAKEAEDAHVEAENANKVAGLAASSAFTAGVTARKAQAEAERAAKENAEMRPIVAQVNKWCGLGAFVYGFGKLIHCLLWLVIGIVVLVVGICVLSAFVPWLAPVFTFVKGLGSRVLALLAKLKPKPKPPTPSPTPPPPPPTTPPPPPTPPPTL